MVNAPEGLNQVVLRKVRRLPKTLLKIFAKLSFPKISQKIILVELFWDEIFGVKDEKLLLKSLLIIALLCLKSLQALKALKLSI